MDLAEKTERMKGLDRCWQVIPEERKEDGRKKRKKRSLATIRLIKTSFLLQAAYSCSHASAATRNSKVDAFSDGGMKKDNVSLLLRKPAHENSPESFANSRCRSIRRVK